MTGTALPGCRTCIALLLLAFMALAGGCAKQGDGTPRTSENDTGDNQITQSQAPQTTVLPESPVPRAREPALGDSADTARADVGGILFEFTKEAPDWKLIEGYDARKGHDFTLVEDGQGVLHLIYNDYHMQTFHCFQKGDGSWSEPRFMVVASTNRQGYWVGTAPDGSLCFAWKEGVFSPERSHYCVLHIMYFRNGKWVEDTKSYDNADENGEYQLTVQWFRIEFDALGEPHFFYYADEFAFFSDDYFADSRCGLYLDGRYLALYDITGQVTIALAEGVGDLANDPQRSLTEQTVYFYIDSGNVYHLIGFDRDSLFSEQYPPSYTRCLHSYSRDGGKTWEGPFIVFDAADPISRISFAEDLSRNLHIMAYCEGSDTASLLTVTLTPENYAGETGTPEGHFGSVSMDEVLRDLPYEERKNYGNLSFRDILLDSDDVPHYIAGGSWSDTFRDITRIEENAWAIRDIEKHAEGAELVAMFLRRSGDFIMLAKEADITGTILYYAEIRGNHW